MKALNKYTKKVVQPVFYVALGLVISKTDDLQTLHSTTHSAEIYLSCEQSPPRNKVSICLFLSFMHLSYQRNFKDMKATTTGS